MSAAVHLPQNYDACSRISFVVSHPEYGHVERRTQLVDVYPTVLDAVGRPCPDGRHGTNLEPVLRDLDRDHREYAISGTWGGSTTITDGDRILHQSPVEGNSPLDWYGITGEGRNALGPCNADTGRREADWQIEPNTVPTWLSDKRVDPNELDHPTDERSGKLAEMRGALEQTLCDLGVPEEHLDRLKIRTD